MQAAGSEIELSPSHEKDAVMNLAQTIPTPDFGAIKTKQNAAWASGDYARIGTTLQIVGEDLAEAMDVSSGAKVLDVAAGNGNATLAFARRWCDVTSTDYVDALLARSRQRAEAEALDVTYRMADAEQLPFADDTFDAVVSTFGVMFTPNQARAASELIRVCRPGGMIGMANWTPDGFIGQVFKTLGRHVAPPPGLASPALWGTSAWLEQHFGPNARRISIEPKMFVFRYKSPAHFMDVFRTYYGPIHKAFLALEGGAQAALARDLEELIAQFNLATDGSMKVPSEYAEIVIDKR
jgi:ubiquinone/menaquinone biosynthesis C-methylase UbiE